MEWSLGGSVSFVLFGMASLALFLHYYLPRLKWDSSCDGLSPEEFEEVQNERKFGVWLNIIIFGIVGTYTNLASWPDSSSYLAWHVSFSPFFITLDLLWWRGTLHRKVCGHLFYSLIVVEFVVGSLFAGKYAPAVLAYYYGTPVLLLGAVAMECSLAFVVCMGAAFCSTAVFAHFFLNSAEPSFCYSCMQADSLGLPIVVPIAVISMYLQLASIRSSIFLRMMTFRDRILASVSHEFKTPLNGITGSLSLLASTNLDEEQRKLVEVAGGCSSLLNMLVGNVLLNSQEKGLSCSVTVVKISDSISKLMLVLQSICPSAQLALRVDAKLADFPIYEMWVEQVLLNLGTNAIKFSGENPKIEFECCLDGPLLKIDVKDRGCGISASFAKYLFLPYRREMKRHVDGSGLGLYICRNLVVRMGGSLEYSRNPLGGSIFTCRFPPAPVGIESLSPITSAPIWTPTEPALPLPNALALTNSETRRRSWRVIVMEDNVVNLNVIVRMLKRAGVLEVDSAISGLEGLEHMFRFVREIGEETTNMLCLVDINMPHLGGVDVVHLWKAYLLRAGGRPPIDAFFCAVTATDETSLPKSLFHRIIPKPLRNEVLVKLLKELGVVEARATNI